MNRHEKELLALGVFGRGARLGERIARLLERGRVFSAGVEKTGVAWSVLALIGCLIAGALAPRMVAFAEELRFEVTSVRPNTAGLRGGGRMPRLVGGRLAWTNVNLIDLLTNAYGVQRFQIVGATGWMNSDRFDVEGKAAGDPTREQMMRMLRTLMKDRLKLSVHEEVKELPVYELVVAKNGVKFKEGKCVGEPGPSNPCGGFSVSLRGSIMGRVAPIEELAAILAGLLSRSVANKTGLDGRYDVDLHWTPDETSPRGPGDPDDPRPDPSGPSIFTALQEQLGLELRSSKGPVEIVVIDHAEKPDEN